METCEGLIVVPVFRVSLVTVTASEALPSDIGHSLSLELLLEVRRRRFK